MTALEEDEVFDPRKGYEGRPYPTHAEKARNAYYQGFITIWEFEQYIHNNCSITSDGQLIWIFPRHNRPAELLTRSRMEQIKIDQLLGIGDGTTSTPTT